MTDKNVLVNKTAADDQPGACYIPDPQTGQQKCHFITKSECDQRGGVFYGGLCPPIDAVADVMLKPGVITAEETDKSKKTRKTKKAKKQAPAERKKKAE